MPRLDCPLDYVTYYDMAYANRSLGSRHHDGAMIIG